MILEFLFGALVLGCGIYLGWAMGKGSSIIPEETKRQVKRLIQSLPIDRGLGAVERPSAQQLKDWDNPLVQEEKDAMSATFKDIVPKQ